MLLLQRSQRIFGHQSRPFSAHNVIADCLCHDLGALIRLAVREVGALLRAVRVLGNQVVCRSDHAAFLVHDRRVRAVGRSEVYHVLPRLPRHLVRLVLREPNDLDLLLFLLGSVLLHLMRLGDPLVYRDGHRQD